MAIEKWKTLSSEVVFDQRIKLLRDVPLLPDGKKGEYVYIGTSLKFPTKG